MMKTWELYVIIIMLPTMQQIRNDYINLHRSHCARWYWLKKDLLEIEG